MEDEVAGNVVILLHELIASMHDKKSVKTRLFFNSEKRLEIFIVLKFLLKFRPQPIPNVLKTILFYRKDLRVSMYSDRK